ncbi:MAG: ribosome maturation factor RimM [Leptolyngbya sp. SIO1D8]|nr:ribosome maturation factor RimM [Leptolyngbya sp. SIO1D8]
MSDSLSEEWLEIGRIVAPQGLDGSVRVYPSSDFPERFLDPGARWLCQPRQSKPEMIQLLSGRYLDGKRLYVLKFAGISNRDQAEAIRDARLLVPQSDRLPVEPDEFHIADLIGLQVRLQETGLTIGIVVDVYSAGNDLLALELTDDYKKLSPSSSLTGKSASVRVSSPVLVPFVHAIVPVVNLEDGYVEITPPKGLLPNL